MVALFGFFDHGEVFIKEFLFWEGDAVDACHGFALGVAAPEGCRYGGYLDGFDGCGGDEVWAATQVGIVALRVGGDVAVVELVDEFEFELLSAVAKEFQGFGLGDAFPYECFAACGQLGHFGVDGFKVAFSDGGAFGGYYVVVEAVLDGGAYAKLCSGVELLQGFGQQVGRGVPEGLFAFFVFPFEEFQCGIGGDGAVQLCDFTVYGA